MNGKSECDLQFGHMCKLPMTGQAARQSGRVEESVCEAAGSNECRPCLRIVSAKIVFFIYTDTIILTTQSNNKCHKVCEERVLEIRSTSNELVWELLFDFGNNISLKLLEF